MEEKKITSVQRHKYIKGGLILTFLMLVIALVFIFILRSKPITEHSTYIYSRLDQYSFMGSTTHSGMSFSKPAELTKLTSADGQVELEHLRTLSSGKQEAVSYIAAASSSSSVALSPAQEEYINYIILKGTAQNYLSTGLYKFINSRIPEGSNFTLGKAIVFPYPNIQSSAWLFPITSSDSKGNKAEGEALYAISGKNYYYFMILNEPFDWQPNLPIWNKVLQSIKLNQ